ncbi:MULTISPECIES: ZIP family metal transporter [Methylobacterium]|jgi:ZIP family zinc transporter|uniref:Zinc transporter ZupT n=3 Tax=Methylobacterium TaxID=407 RepID=A0A509EG76_9HYPH|nr:MULTISPECIES: transporter [Methylobacterium]AYO86544.1 transporter [Methylobacterium brachiatum]MBP29081.1 transporter [Methylobacterium sp.]MBP29158.1 transporter [Methylobacterium sp.]MCB4806326.1 transporter [Methylobacterium brachiatum]MDQ0547245.1 ZIP family zinc transporter [Methylobacterium brachiatum]
MSAWAYTLIPALATVLGAAVAAVRQPGPAVTSAVQHLAAGVLFAAVAGEILPDLKHQQSPIAVIVGGALGVALMLLVKRLGEKAKGSVGLIATVGIDILIDGLVLGIGFAAGAKQGLLLTGALTLEVLFLGIAVASKLKQTSGSAGRVVGTVAGLALLLPLGALLGTPVGALPGPYLAGFFAFALVALLYLVTEELLVEAHAVPEQPWTTAMFFIGFLGMLVIEEIAT